MKFDNVQHLLPESARLFVRLIGLPKAVLLINTWGGTTFPVSKNQTRLGQIRYESLAEVVGIEAAGILTRHFGGEVLAVPLCKAAMLELRNRAIRNEFDDISREHSAIHAAGQLARKYQMTERHVWRVLKQADVAEEAKQSTLF